MLRISPPLTVNAAEVDESLGKWTQRSRKSRGGAVAPAVHEAWLLR